MTLNKTQSRRSVIKSIVGAGAMTAIAGCSEADATSQPDSDTSNAESGGGGKGESKDSSSSANSKLFDAVTVDADEAAIIAGLDMKAVNNHVQNTEAARLIATTAAAGEAVYDEPLEHISGDEATIPIYPEGFVAENPLVGDVTVELVDPEGDALADAGLRIEPDLEVTNWRLESYDPENWRYPDPTLDSVNVVLELTSSGSAPAKVDDWTHSTSADYLEVSDGGAFVPAQGDAEESFAPGESFTFDFLADPAALVYDGDEANPISPGTTETVTTTIQLKHTDATVTIETTVEYRGEQTEEELGRYVMKSNSDIQVSVDA